MKSKYIFIIIVLAILAVALFSYNNNGERTDTATNTEVTDKDSVPSTLTLASLEAREDWNPTTEVEGVVRVEDGIPDLQVQEYPVYTEENSGFVLKYLEPVISQEMCDKYGVAEHPYYGKSYCLETSPELFNELIILSKDTGEVLHKFSLKEGYSLIIQKAVTEGFIARLGFSNETEDLYVFIYINKWDNFADQMDNSHFKKYHLDLFTGKITEEERR